MNDEIAGLLAAKGVATQEQLADLDGDELIEITGMDADSANQLIMAARAPWFV
jgi:N utilization substance protein A